jgi:hypothetical protein
MEPGLDSGLISSGVVEPESILIGTIEIQVKFEIVSFESFSMS